MLDSFPIVVLISSILGFLAGLGIGGGSLLILWLTFVLNMDPSIARVINLLFFLPSALICGYFRWKEGCIEFKDIFPAILSGFLSAGIFSWISTTIDTELLKKAFGVLLILTGIREVLYNPKKKQEQS